MSAMNLTPAMIRPMEIMIINSSSENPRFRFDFINFWEEQTPPIEPARAPVRPAHKAEDRAFIAEYKNASRSFIAAFIF